MKTTMFLATATAALLLTVSTGSASPKDKALADSLAKESGTTADMIDRSVQSASPKHIAMVESLRKVAGTTPDMLTRALPAASPKVLANEPWRFETFHVAPLK